MRKPINWEDRSVEFPNRFSLTDLGSGMVQLVRAPGTVYKQGTPQSAEKFNGMDLAILDNELATSILIIHQRHLFARIAALETN